jgi:hypothetical protein
MTAVENAPVKIAKGRRNGVSAAFGIGIGIGVAADTDS